MPQFHMLSNRADTQQDFTDDAGRHADLYLSKLAGAAAEAGVPCDTTAVIDDPPYQAIIAVAEKRGCDLVVMASHGRKGIQALLLGSETNKVLTHTRIPVLVLHAD